MKLWLRKSKYKLILSKLRDYRYLNNSPRSFKPSQLKIIKPGYKYKLVTEAEKLNKEYQKKDVVFDDFSKMYHVRKEMEEIHVNNSNNLYFYNYKNNKQLSSRNKIDKNKELKDFFQSGIVKNIDY